MPSGWIKKAWREHRTVMLPDFQGLGIGVRMSDAVAQIHLDEGKRYYSKTAHPRMGEYRNKSSLWRATSMNGSFQSEDMMNSKSGFNRTLRINKVCFSHEFVGASNSLKQPAPVADPVAPKENKFTGNWWDK